MGRMTTSVLTQRRSPYYSQEREIGDSSFTVRIPGVTLQPLNASRFVCAVLLIAALSGCSMDYYAHTKQGVFYGATCLDWKNQHEFAFHQNPAHPFYFQRANGEKIIPKSIYTDGGSIPRALWAFRGYSPWEYGPAFIIHDWLFIAHHCQAIGYERYDVNEAADVMSECIKTLMETKPPIVDKDPRRMYRMNLAVRSFVAKRLWREGDCPPQPPDIAAEQQQQSQRELRRRAPRSRPMKVAPKKVPAEAKAPLHEQLLDKLIQTAPVP
jgi:Protein of unknown function (DUF1353)